MQHYYSWFEGLLHKMMSKKPFMNQEIRYINGNGGSKLCTMSDYIKEFLSKIETEKKKYHIFSKWKTPIELVSGELIISIDGLHT